MGQSKKTELQIFAGGLNLQPASHLVDQHYARNLANGNIRHLRLEPFLAPLFQQDATGNFVFHFNGEFQFFDKFRSNVKYSDVWYWTEIGDAGKVYKDGTELPLGISPPIGRLAISAGTPSVGDGLEGNINYVYTYYDPESGSESPPSAPSPTLDLTGANAGKSITIDDIVPSPDGYETRLYRIGGIITAYSAVVTLDNAILSYVDQLSFSEIQAIILDTLRAYPPPFNLQHLTVHQGRFYGAVDSKLYFSAPGKPDSWYLLDFLAFEQKITGVVSVANGLIVSTIDKSWLVTGISPIQFVKHTLSDSEGCVSFASIAVNEGTAIWLSLSGFVMSNGGKVENISLDKIGRFKQMTPLGAAFLDKRYYMSFTGVLLPDDDLLPADDLYPGSIVNDGGISLPPGAIVIDFAKGAPAFTTLADEDMGQLIVNESKLYHMRGSLPELNNLVIEPGTHNFVTEDNLYNIIAVTNTNEALMRTMADGLRSLTYLSPVLTEGSIGMAKQYEKVRVTFSGVLTISIFDENTNLLATQKLSSLKRTNEWVGIPVGNNRGYGIQFLVEGKCIVDSILYVWTPQESQ